MGKGQAAKDKDLVEGSPVISVIGTTTDTPVSELRSKVKEVTKVEEGYPQILMRMGYGHEVTPTPRRSIEEVFR